MIPFKAVAIDMDGTFLRDDKSYDKKLFSELLNKMKEKDIHFIVASGNQFERTRLDFTEYWKDMSFVAENGMYLVDDGKDLSYEQLDRSLVEELVEFMAQRPELTPALCGKENAYLEKNSDSKFVKMMKYYLPKHNGSFTVELKYFRSMPWYKAIFLSNFFNFILVLFRTLWYNRVG